MVVTILTNLAVLVLTIVTAVFSEFTYQEILLGGILMILITAGQLTEGYGKLIFIPEFLVSVLFAVLSGNFTGFLVFSLIIGLKPLQALLAADGLYIVVALADMMRAGGFEGRNIALILVRFVVLTIAVLIMAYLRELLMFGRKRREEEKERRVNLSLREMHEIKKNRELTLQNVYAEKNARLVERENISRNIHNSVGHSITAAIMTLDAADMLFEKKPEEAHKRMNDAADRIRGSLEAIRSAVRALDDDDTEVSVKDLLCYINNILDEFTMDTDRSVDKIYDLYSDNMTIPKEQVEFLTGALGEMLTNGVKHGGARHFVVTLSGDSAHIKLEVKDDGKGIFNESNREELIKNGFGLKKLETYVKRCGGTTYFENNNGFKSVIELPLWAGDREK